jgi:hypothetical protein
MSGRMAYLDPFDNDTTIIPRDFPDYTQINGGEYYDYYKVNNWFNKGGYVFKLTWTEAQAIIDAFDSDPSEISSKISSQLLQYAKNERE